MTQALNNLQGLVGPDMPLQPAQRAILGPLCDAEGNQRRVSRLVLLAAAGLSDPDPVVNSYGLRRILGSITQRLNSSDWYVSMADPIAPGGRSYILREDLRDELFEILA